MRTLFVISLLLFLGVDAVRAAGDTNEFTLFNYQARRQAYEWRISESRILTTPDWSIGITNIPVSPDKAWQITKDWFSKEGRGEPDFLRMEIRSFDPAGTHKAFRKKFFYRVECVPTQSDSMLVVILMDGTVVEPRRIPHLPAQEIK